ncbi:MAG: glutathione S-transferase C-terminal domain-containing protein [Alphaproteobacteria bacterium]|nr:glutathione S-transferase C-terminal domain-containing protein [Alphaproteobacteria bacterium]
MARLALAAEGLAVTDHGAGVPRMPAPAQPLPVLVHEGRIYAGLGPVLRHIAHDIAKPATSWSMKPAPNREPHEALAWISDAVEAAPLADGLTRHSLAGSGAPLLRLIKGRLDETLSTRAWLSPGRPGVADFAWAVIVRRAEWAGFDVSAHPALRQWLTRLDRKVKLHRFTAPPARRLGGNEAVPLGPARPALI